MRFYDSQIGDHAHSPHGTVVDFSVFGMESVQYGLRDQVFEIVA